MGGGVMRAAAKAAAVGGYRAAHVPWVEQGVAAAARGSARPPQAALAVSGQAAEGAPTLYAASSAQSAPIDAGAAAREQRTSWNVDGWEVVVRDEGDLFDTLRPAAPARLVFGPVPTLEEAKEATSDLKDALEKLYFSPTASGLQGSAATARSNFSESSCLESMGLDAKNRCSAVIPSAPTHVVQAFSLLQGCPEAQDVVASLASDKSVWDAVMKNEKVMEFYKTHQINTSPVETGGYQEESVSEDGKPMDSSDGKEAPESSENGFMGFVRTIKVKVKEMVNNLSDFFKDWMGTTETKTTTTTGEGSHFNMGPGAYFFALAISTILVILVKRA